MKTLFAPVKLAVLCTLVALFLSAQYPQSGGSSSGGASGGTPPAYTTVTFVAAGMTFATTTATAQGFTYTLTASMSGASTFSPALTKGQTVYLRPCQNGTGGWTNSYPAIVANAGAVETTASVCTSQGFQFDGTNLNPTGPPVSTNSIPGVVLSDVALWREAAGVLDIGSGTANDKSAYVKLAGIASAGTKFTTTGCSISSTTGGAVAGTFTLGANTCTAVITLNGATGLTAPTGWSCWAADSTAPAVLVSESATTTTTASFSVPAGAGATDVIRFGCLAY